QASGPSGVPASRFEVVVVADGCQDETVPLLQESTRTGEWSFALRVVEQAPARGAGITRNVGAAHATGATLVFIDDDIEPFPSMMSTHIRRHADAASARESLVLIGAPVPVRTADGSLHRIAAWGWWEQQFERMSEPGHRFTYDEVFTGVLSMPAALFHAVGGFDALLGDCHEDSELGLRLFRAGARVAFSREGGGMHHEVRSILQLLPRKWAEGRADVRILRRWPELLSVLAIGKPEAPRATLLGFVRRLAFRATGRALLQARGATRLALVLLAWLDRWRWRNTWRFLHGGILTYSYWKGAANEIGSAANLAALVAESRVGRAQWYERSRHLAIDLDEGLEAAERSLDVVRPDWITVQLGGQVVGSTDAIPEAERLHGGHLRRLLATTLRHEMQVTLAMRTIQQHRPEGLGADVGDKILYGTADASTSVPSATVPRISVIVPKRSARDTICRTLDSLLAQTMTQWEAIVVDDGSTDGTGVSIDGYARDDARIRVVRQAHLGLSDARNSGVARATAEWLHFLDAGDWMAPTAFERLLAAGDADASIDAVHCGWSRVADDGTLIAESRCWQEGDLFELFAARRVFALHACLVRRSVVEEIGGFDPDFATSQDWVLWQRVARRGARFGSVPDTLAFSAPHPAWLSSDPLQLLHEPLEIITLGHRADPRVPGGKHAGGRPAHELPGAQLRYACWVAGVMIAKGKDASILLARIPRPPSPPPPIFIAESLLRAVSSSLGMPTGAWRDVWSRVEPVLARFLEALEQHVDTPGYARAVRAAVERGVAPFVTESHTLGLHAVISCEITSPITDVVVPAGAERLAANVYADGRRVGLVELPAVGGRVTATVLRDAIAAEYAWPILGCFFEREIYRAVKFVEKDGSTSAWIDGVQVADNLPAD
ncbi:MAG: glycosyltransferase, partial [Gemmatimonadaceae bacterium]